MLNQSIIIGRIVNDIKKINKEDKKIKITLAVPRSYKNSEGEYDIDFIPCILWNSIAQSTLEYCKKGDLIGIKGRIQKLEEDEEMTLIAEKVTFLSTKENE